jgi:small ligand-binding sensory domain FIST
VSYAAALSEHPLPTHAVGEVVGEVLERLGERPDLALLFVSGRHTGVVEEIGRAVRELLSPGWLVGCTAGTVVGGDREVEDEPAVALWAGTFPSLAAYRLEAVPAPEGMAVTGFPRRDELPLDAAAVLLLADPWSFPTAELLEGLREQAGIELPVVGGMASAGRAAGGNRLLLDDRVHSDGAVAVVVGGVEVDTVVSQGCRPIGEPMVVTSGEGQVVRELAGRPALERVQEVLAGLAPADLSLARSGLHVGLVVDEHKAEFGPGDFLVRNVLGADREAGAVAVGAAVEVGTTVQLQVRDAASADADLRELLEGRRADAALLFTCNGRGMHLFGVPDHDASAVSEAIERRPLAGMSCAGEVGPVGGRSFVHGFTASIALFGPQRSP